MRTQINVVKSNNWAWVTKRFLASLSSKGKNIIQIPKNTFIEKAIISADAARITLSDNKQITINNADKFTFNLGGNISSGEAGVNLNFEEFALIFDVNILDISSTVSVISDFYI